MATLATYRLAIRNIIHDPNAQFFTLAVLNGFIQQARQQVAMEGECLRALVSVNTVAGQVQYLHSAVPPASAAVAGLLSVQAISFLDQASGDIDIVSTRTPLESRPWAWFDFYWRTMARPPPQAPQAWAPFQDGIGGSFYIAPEPDSTYALLVDGAWLPVDLPDDTTVDILSFPWTDAVQFYAAYLAYLDSQRYGDADKMLSLYESYMMRARGGTTPLTTSSSHPGGAAGRTAQGMAPPTRLPAAPPKAQQ